ncbi:hypothetical protein D3C87_1221630 [compost metagenome]
MKSFIAIILASFFVGPVAFAEVYECVTVPQEDPWTGLGGAGSDIWTAIVDLDNGTVELNSENELFGANPFAVLKEESLRGVTKGTRVFRGNNQNNEFKTDTYLLSFSKKGSALERQEGSARERSFDSLECQRVK